jgi:uncharacterized protein (DUF169 family)
MKAKTKDYSVLDKFRFERSPVGVKFLATRPEGIPRISKELNFCEMLKEAQENGAFYVAPEDWVCVGVEQMILGMEDPEPVLVTGMLGGDEGLYKEDSACRAMYVAFAPLSKMTFDPDVLIMTADINQAQVLLRSVNYSTGQPYVSRATPVVACAWMYVYPVVSGELNYFITGLGLGMQELNIFPPGLFIISIPFQVLPIALDNLKEIGANPTPPGPGGPAHRKRVNQLLEDLRKRFKE